jgi:hypothetical protein
MYNDALGTQAFTPENEMTFMVVPYFAPTVTALDTNLTYDWQVNGKKVETDRVRPNEITINSAGSSGDATISVALTHLTNFFMSAAGSWNISLSSTGPGNNHNTNGPNLFHPQE